MIGLRFGLPLFALGGAVPDRTTGVELDGVNDQLDRTSSLVGAVENKTLLFSAWIEPHAGSGDRRLWSSSAGSSSGLLSIEIREAGGTLNVFAYAAGTLNVAISWQTPNGSIPYDGYHHHVAVAIDLAAGTALCYVDGVDKSPSSPTLNDELIGWTGHDIAAFATEANGLARYDGCAAEYLLTNEFLDISQSANLEKLRTATGLPADLGLDGSAVTGTVPLVYFSGGASQFANNFGSGGPFTIVGTLEDCALQLTIPLPANDLSHAHALDAAQLSQSWLTASDLEHGHTATSPTLAYFGAQAAGVLFSGNNQWYERTSPLLGVTANKQIAMSYYFSSEERNNDQAFFQLTDSSGNGEIIIEWDDSESAWHVRCRPAGSSTGIAVEFLVPDQGLSDNLFTHHVCFSVDCAVGVSSLTVAIDGRQIPTSALQNVTVNDEVLGWENDTCRVGLDRSGGRAWQGACFEMWAANQYIDFDDDAEILKFRTPGGRPANLGPAGELPTGTSPPIYLSGGAAEFGLNDGTGGSFTQRGNPTTIFFPTQTFGEMLEHGNVLTSSALSPMTPMSVQDVEHAHTLTESSFVPGTPIAPDDVEHAQIMTPSGLTSHAPMQPQDLLHLHEVGAVALAPVSPLAPSDVQHVHLLTRPALAAFLPLDIDDAQHGHILEDPALGVPGALQATSLTHGHVVTSPALPSVSPLAIDPAVHGHTLDAPALVTGMPMPVRDLMNAHFMTSPDLAFEGAFDPEDLFHAHAMTSPILVSHAIMPIDGATHGHILTSANLVEPTDVPPAKGGRLVLVRARDRAVQVRKRARIITVH